MKMQWAAVVVELVLVSQGKDAEIQGIFPSVYFNCITVAVMLRFLAVQLPWPWQ